MAKRLNTLMELMQERGVGNTTLLLNGINFDRPAVLIFADQYSLESAFDNALKAAAIGTPYIKKASAFKQVSALRQINDVQFVTIAKLDNIAWWRGKRCPVGIDHFALMELIKEERLEWQAQLERVRANV